MIKCKVCHYITQKANQIVILIINKINNKKIYKEKRMKFLNMMITLAFKIYHIKKEFATVTSKPKLNHLLQIKESNKT